MLLLSKEQIDTYLNDGVLVVDDVLTEYEIHNALKGLHENTFIQKYGIKPNVAMHYLSSLLQLSSEESSSSSSSSNNNDNNGNDESNDENNDDLNVDVNDNDIDESNNIWDDESIESFMKLSSTNGSGGVLDVFYEDWKMDISSNEKIWNITKQLWNAAYNNNNNNNQEETTTTTTTTNNENYFKHQYNNEDIDYNKGYMYIDRIGYRLPTNLSQKLGDRYYSNSNNNNNSQNNSNNKDNKTSNKKKKSNKKSRRNNSIQRSLTPHLDCCPTTFYSTTGKTKKWRPIQCFVSLTDNLQPNTGGFEAAKGFHKQFDNWITTRIPTKTKTKTKEGSESISIPPQHTCIGEYTHMRPKEDFDIYKRIEHIPNIKAGSVVLWDNRIPHSNSYKHTGQLPRIVVYCSYLPDIKLNRLYMKKQLQNYQSNIVPKDQWNHIIDDDNENENENNDDDEQKQRHEEEEDSNATITGDEMKEKKEVVMPPLHSYYKFTDLGRKLIGLDPW